MRESGLYLPSYFKYQHYNNRYNIEFEEKDNTYFVALHKFRDIYKNNRSEFSKITKELVLRGGEFFLKNESPLFPRVENIGPKIIRQTEKTPVEAYKNIDYRLLDLYRVIKDLDIQGNYFFDFIPLNGFKVFNLSNTDIQILENNLMKNGFLVTENPETPSNYHIKKGRKNIGTLMNKNDKAVDDIKKAFNTIKDNKFYKFIQITEINLDNDIIQSLQENDIDTVHDISENSENLSLVLNLNKKEQQKIIKIINNLPLNHKLIATKIDNFVNKNSELINYPIHSLLQESQYKLFRNTAYELGIETLGDLTMNNVIVLFNSKGIGKGKIYNFINDLSELANEEVQKELIEERKLNEEKPIYFTFGLIKNTMVREYIIANKLTFVTKTKLYTLLENVNMKKKIRKETLNTLNSNLHILNNMNWKNIENNKKYKLSITQILETLKVEYLIEDEAIKNHQEILNKPIYKLIPQIDNLSFEIKQTIFIYINSVNYFDSIYEKNVYELFDLNKREQIILDNRVNTEEVKTLEELGELLDITRERVRQIERKVKKKIEISFNTELLNLYREHLYSNKIFNIEDNKFKNIILSLELDSFHYDEELDIFMDKDNEVYIKKVKQKIEKIIDEKKILEMNEVIDFIEEMKNEQNKLLINKFIDNIYNYFQKTSYTIKNNLVYGKGLSKENTYIYIIKKYYSREVLDFSSETSFNTFMNRLRNIAPGKFIEDLSMRNKYDLTRSIESILDRQSDIILKIDAHKYKLLDVNRIPYALMDDIYEYIKDEILENEFVSVKKIYWKYKIEIEEAGYSEKTLYYILKLLFEDDFEFQGKTSMRLYEKGSSHKTTYEIVLSMLEKNNGKMSLNNLMEEMGAENYTIYQQVANNTDIIVQNNEVILREGGINLSSETIQSITTIFENLLEKQNYVPVKGVYDEVKFMGDVNKDLVNNGYENADNLTHLLKFLFPETEGHTKVLFNRDSEQNYLDIFVNEIGNKEDYHREEFLEAGKNIGLAEQTTNMYFNKFIDNGEIVPLNADYFIFPEQLNFDENILLEIDTFINKYMRNNGYLSLTSIQSYVYDLSRLERYRWSIQLLNYFSTQYLDYKKIDINHMHYDKDPMIIIKKSSNLTYKDIVIKEMKQYDGVRTEEKVLQYLKEQGLLKNNARKIYQWFYDRNIFYLNDIGRIYLSEDEINV